MKDFTLKFYKRWYVLVKKVNKLVFNYYNIIIIYFMLFYLNIIINIKKETVRCTSYKLVVIYFRYFNNIDMYLFFFIMKDK